MRFEEDTPAPANAPTCATSKGKAWVRGGDGGLLLAVIFWLQW